MLRSMLIALVLSLGALTDVPAQAAVPARFRVCASVEWTPPSLDAQRRRLGRNPRWSEADRADPLPALQFPFIVRLRSGSISYDQGELGGLWTVSRRARSRLIRCPYPGGPRRNYVVFVKGWRVTRAELADSGEVVAYGTPWPGRLQVLHFPGYGTVQGLGQRRFSLERTDAPGCAIDSIASPIANYYDLDGRGIGCAELRLLQVALDESPDWAGPTQGFTCAAGLSNVVWLRVACADGTGRTLRFSYSDGADE